MEQLEVLLLLRAESDREWTSRDIARKLGATESAIDLRLADLYAGRLVSRAETRYRYAPDVREAADIDSLAGLYRSRRTAVIQLIFSGASDSVRSFADAFRLGADEEEKEGDD